MVAWIYETEIAEPWLMIIVIMSPCSGLELKRKVR
jgi:hypothetical protein